MPGFLRDGHNCAKNYKQRNVSRINKMYGAAHGALIAYNTIPRVQAMRLQLASDDLPTGTLTYVISYSLVPRPPPSLVWG